MSVYEVSNIAGMNPVVNRSEFVMEWNHDAMKSYLQAQLEKYEGLVVTEDNLKDMQSTLREVVSFRTKLSKFGTEQKRKLKEPINQFEVELNSVLRVVEEVEYPLRKQIDLFEQRAMLERRASVEKEIALKTEALGIREEYRIGIVPNPKWWENKTAKLSEVTAGIDAMLKEVLDKQKADDEFKALQEEKKEMLRMKINLFNENYELATPLTFEEVYPLVSHLTIADATEAIRDEFDKRMEIECAASSKEEVQEAERKVQEVEVKVQENELPIIDVQAEIVEERYNSTFILKDVTDKEVNAVKAFLSKCNIKFTTI